MPVQRENAGLGAGTTSGASTGASGGAVGALLGPTNTGKTHQAIGRMLEHRSGMIGLPLRLLAREVYDRVSAQVGEAAVALITGEEKRVPARPRYWVCTVESMPVTQAVDFVAIDEVQLAAHRERGHVFTDRLLHLRGALETMFLGSDTMTAIVQELVPGVQVERHPRFSRLKSLPACELAQLAPRSAVVAFSAAQVYELAEKLKRRRGGAAVVLGALSPRTRNAQVAMYQAGEVAYLVATDAIGMGLNMDVDHVAFAALSKFDGKVMRPLEPAELAQIAGRAGRYTKDGSFGLLSGLPALPHSVVAQIEGHRFPAIERLVWRSSEFDYASVAALQASLKRRPTLPQLRLVERSDDADALAELALLPEVQALARGPEKVELLWAVCRIPDFRKLLEGSHVRLLAGVFTQLARDGRLDPAWMDRRIRHLDNDEGDIEALMSRISFVRTWTYISHHGHWVADPEHWQGLTRAIEDRLSDALHERLTQRFVDPRGRSFSAAASVEPRTPVGRVADAGARGRAVVDADHPFRQLAALRLAEVAEQGPLADEAARIVEAPHEAFAVDARGQIRLGELVVASMSRGADLLRPEVQLMLAEGFGAGAQAQVRRRLLAWTRDLVAELLAPLRAEAAGRLKAAGKGLVYQLEHGLGSLLRARCEAQVQGLDADDRKLCGQLKIQLGALVVFVPALLEPAALLRRAALWSAANGRPPALPATGRVSLSVEEEVPASWYHTIGYPPFGPRAVRADQAERMFGRLLQATSAGPTALPPELASWLGCSQAEAGEVAEAMGLTRVDDERYVFVRAERGRRGKRRGAPR
ncbi:MAG: helicase [Nannocystis sp.]|nr:helicase [Nannocystis sp.]